MKEYTFEYTRQGFTYTLFGLSFAFLILGAILGHRFLSDVVPAGVAVTLLLILSVGFFILNKRKVKRIGVAKLSATNLLLELNELKNISFSDLKYYYIYNGKNGAVFTLGFINGTKLKMSANDNFCNVEPFKDFLKEFQLVVEKYKAENHSNIIHLESIYAKRQTPYILGVLTVLVIAGFCFTTMPVMILPIGVSAGLFTGWIQYFQLRSQGKLVDF